MLSHLWGSGVYFKFTITTVRQLSAGVMIKRLPQRFRDVFDAARQLGVRYL